MNQLRRDWQEWAIIASLVTACLVLAVLQYRWTGELSRAESQRLFTTAGDRLQQLARAFDAELRQSVLGFVPSAEEVQNLGPARANEERLRGVNLDRPIFRRIAAAVPDGSSTLQYLEANLAEQRFLPAQWPQSKDWQTLRARLQDVARGGDPRGGMIDPASALIEIPVFAGDIEREWMMFELDTDYAAKSWLPDLMRIYLTNENERSFGVSVVWSSARSRVVLGSAQGMAADAEATIFPMRFFGRGGGGRGGRDAQGRWLVRVSHPAGSVPAAVKSARNRNLGVALILLAMIAVAGAALVRITRQARRLADAQYQFFAGISHELRTPLTVIQGAGHNLLSGVVKDEAQRESYARAIIKQSAQLNEMVDQVLSYGAARKGQPLDRAGSTLLDVVVSEAIESAALELEQSGRSVDVDMPPDLPAVRGDQTSLRRVVGNLILNAIRHGGGEVRVSAAQSGDMVEVQVADSGNGIPPEELKQVFDPFFRGKRARTGRTRGTGLGLSLVKETVEKLGGSVDVESNHGKGTVFTVRLLVAG